MGKRIMADLVKGDVRRTMVTRPRSASWTLKVPEPATANDGPTGFFGVTDIVRSRQALAVEVEHSGDYPNYYRDQGARFVFEPDQLWDAADSDVVGALNPLGGEQASVPVYTQTLLGADNDVQLGSPKMIKLEKHGRCSPVRGIVGLLGAVGWTGSPNGPQILFWTMDEYDDHGCAPVVSYQWEYRLSLSPTSASTTMPAFDMVELDDGSIVFVLVVGSYMYVYKSFDGGANWDQIASFPLTPIDTVRKVAIDRIGSRLVIVTSLDPGGGGGDCIFSYHSSDGGISWSSPATVLTTTGAQTVIDIDMHMGQNGYLYLMYVTDVGGTDRVCWRRSLDGVFGSGQTATTVIFPWLPHTFTQEYYGRWLVYGATVNDQIREWGSGGGVDGQNPWYELSGGNRVNRRAGDGDGCDFEELCAREFFGGFVDVVALVHDDHGTDFYNLVVYRLCMWSGVQFDQTVVAWDAVWTPHAYPSTNDPHPNLNVWTEAQLLAGAVALGSDNSFHHMEITSGAGVDVKTYRYPATGSDGAWDDGLTARFELKVVSGYIKVNCRLTSAASNKDVNFTVEIQPDRVILYDENAGAGADVIVPTDWNPSTWNEYTIIAKENEVQVFRSPSGTYREIAHYEEIVKYETLQEDAYAGAGDNRVMWGVSPILGSGSDATESHWRSMMVLVDEAFDVDWDFSSCHGKRCHGNPVGLLQGIACKWDGEFAVDGDDWELDVGAHFDADNILVDSPRIRWAEPLRVPLSAAAVDVNFEWEREDADGVCMNMTFNAVALFGLNHWRWRLYGLDFGGGGAQTLFLNVPDGDMGNVIYDGLFEVAASYPDQNVVQVAAGTTTWDGAFVPNQFASDDYRNWYVCFQSGSCDDRIYRILANTEDTLFLECNVQSDGVVDGDDFLIFADRCLCLLPATHSYPRVRLWYRVPGFTPSPGEAQFRLGTVVLGMLHDLPDDEWEFSTRTEPAVRVEEGRGGLRQFREEGPERRMIDLAYTGCIDEGMGVHSTRELYRFLRWGVHPVVWIDDDTVFDGVSSPSGVPYGHTDPILARARGPVSQKHRAYYPVTKDGIIRVRNILDMGGVTLEEVL